MEKIFEGIYKAVTSSEDSRTWEICNNLTINASIVEGYKAIITFTYDDSEDIYISEQIKINFKSAGSIEDHISSLWTKVRNKLKVELDFEELDKIEDEIYKETDDIISPWAQVEKFIRNKFMSFRKGRPVREE